jgi:hypothetical protein|nr:trypsin-like peptidase domain-containing protein [Candidatus Krumholzibacteria bacterium]
MNKTRFALIAMLLLGAGSVLGAGTGGTPLTGTDRVLPTAQIDAVTMAGADKVALARDDAERALQGEPYRFAVPNRVQISPVDAGTWEVLAGGDRVWRLRLDCPGALSVGLGFDLFRLPAGARLLVLAADGQGPVYSFGPEDNQAHGQLWTPVILADQVILELRLPFGTFADWDLQLGTVGWGYRYFGEGSSDKSGSCNIDVNCPEGDDWRDEIATVGVYTIGATWKCTGVMVNNTAEDERPLFLTAHHCSVTASAAPTVVIYWNYESPTCGQQGGGSLAEFSTGTTLLASYSISDFTLLELEEDLDPAFGVNFAGWDRSPGVPASAVCIHHPSTDEKSISFENDPLSITTYLEDVGPGNNTHLRVADWDLGTTEGGSSGSPLFNASHLIVGQLHGGYAACGNDEPDWYGRLYISWSGGGSPSTRLSDWLDPDGLGVSTLTLLEGGQGYVPPAEKANLRITGMAPNPFLDFVEFDVEVDRDATSTVRIYDVAGRLVVDLGRRNFEFGEDNKVAWGGDDADGARVASGMYVLVLEAEGKTVRQSFTRLN